MWVTDLRDAANPVVSDEPVDLWRNDGYTDYSHDVDEDERGIAWVAGRGGIRGYATSGRHRDPYQNRVRRATPFDPILVAGGGLQWDVPPARQGDDGVAQATDFMHNSGRPTDGSVRAPGVKKGNVLIGTEEDFTTPCEQSGRIVAVDLTDSWGGEPAQNSTRANPYRMKALSSFHPFLDTPETANPSLGCSAHYFEIRQSTLAAGWYGQGLRLVDVSDASDMRQIGYYRVTARTPATRPRTRGTWPGTTTASRRAAGTAVTGATTCTCSTWRAGSRCSGCVAAARTRRRACSRSPRRAFAGTTGGRRRRWRAPAWPLTAASSVRCSPEVSGWPPRTRVRGGRPAQVAAYSTAIS